ncbi:uncharacterized protein LOC141512731 isoform X1 [Macrotis lagotis]|uniref:uncharacterized protein LOC141512731 isoform X1 n=1 Tax=Macrotis lagotis TaxID=92651 RepID=UPI003D683BD7
MATPPKRDKNTSDQECQNTKEKEDLEDSSKELISRMATPPKISKRTSDQELQKAKEKEDLEDSSKELISKMTTPPKIRKRASDQELQNIKQKEDLEDSSEELISKMATPPKISKRTSDQELQKLKEKENLEVSSKELISKMAIPPKISKRTSDQELQKTKKKEDLEDSSKVSETKLLPPRPGGPSQVSPDPSTQKIDVPSSQKVKPVVPAAPSQKPVSKGAKHECAPKNPQQDRPQATSSIQMQLPLLRKLSRFLSKQTRRRTQPTVSRNQRQEPPTLLQAPLASMISRRGRYLYSTTKKPRVLVNYQRTMASSCRHCRRVSRPHSCPFTRMTSRLRNLERLLRSPAIQNYLNRNLQSQSRTSVGKQPCSPTSKRQRRFRDFRNEPREEDFTLACEYRGLRGPFQCPCCSETCRDGADFVIHLKKHSGIKVTVMVDEPNLFLCPYCKQTFDGQQTILTHPCPAQ